MYRSPNGRQGSDGWAAAVATGVTVVSDATASDAAARPPDVVIIISHGHVIVNRVSVNLHLVYNLWKPWREAPTDCAI